MKKYILILGILISATALFTTCEQSEVQPTPSDGNFRLSRIETIDNLTNQTPMYIQSFEYQDQVLDQTYDYMTNGDTISYTKYFYTDDQLSHTEKYNRKITGTFELMIRKEYLYNNDRLDKELIIYNLGSGSEKIDYDFNANGQLTHKRYYDANDNLTFIEEYIYANDELIRINLKNKDGILTGYHTYSNPDELTLKNTVYTPNDEVIRIISTTYDHNGNISFVKHDEIALWSSRSDNLQKYIYEEL